MKKILHSKLFSFILGAIIFSTISVYAVVLMDSEEITFTTKDNNWKVNNVQEALDDLYQKEPHEEYTETTTITPNESIQTLSTKNKVLKDNIIIDRVPEIYKNLTTNTTVNETNMLKGITAYDKNGKLITGIISSTECVFGTFVCDSDCTGSAGKVVVSEFIPSKFVMVTNNSNNNENVSFNYNKEVDSSNVNTYYFNTTTGTKNLLSKYWNTDNNMLSVHNWASRFYNISVDYIACK